MAGEDFPKLLRALIEAQRAEAEKMKAEIKELREAVGLDGERRPLPALTPTEAA